MGEGGGKRGGSTRESIKWGGGGGGGGRNGKRETDEQAVTETHTATDSRTQKSCRACDHPLPPPKKKKRKNKIKQNKPFTDILMGDSPPCVTGSVYFQN